MTKQILLSLLNCSWQWLLLSGLIWFVATRLRRSKTTAHLLWLLSLLSLPILFGLNQFVPALSIGENPVPELAQAKPIDVSGLAALTTDLPEISPTQSDTQSKSQLLAESKLFTNWAKTDLLLCVWAIGALVMLVRFMFGLLRIHQLRRSAVVADDSYQSICRRLEQQLDINRRVTVCFSDRVASPISFGWLSPYILIPRKLDLEQFELVAAHELAHVQRLDWLTNLFSHLVGVIFFFHPIYHFLNRELVRVRERICDDWVIRLTGARKNYAQCLLDLVRHEDRTVSLALSLNQPSQLESRIDSILKNNRQLDVKLKPRLRLIAATLVLTCLPLLAMAQLVPLKTFQVSLFAQTPEKSEKAVDKTQKKQVMEKAKDGKLDGKQYKDELHIEVKDPTLFEQSEENKIFSGPQPGEKLPSLTVRGIDGELDGQMYDITAKADGKPLILFLQDTNGVGVKGLVNVSKLLLKIDAFQKRHSKAAGDEKSNQGLQIGVVFLADSLDTLPEWAHDMLNEEISNEVLTGISPDGREGPGSYGLNRNVAQTVLIAKDGKVLHNFAFTQPMLYGDPHFLGAVADAIGADAPALEKWLNEAPADDQRMQRDKEKMEGKSNHKEELVEQLNTFQKGLQRLTESVLTVKGESKKDTLDRLEKLLKQVEALDERFQRINESVSAVKQESKKARLDRLEELSKEVKALNERLQRINKSVSAAKRESQNRYRSGNVEVKNPAEFKKTQGTTIFSGPQPGEKLPPLKVKGINGETKDKMYDVIAKADGQVLVLFLQDESGLGLRGLLGISRLLDQIVEKSKQKMYISAVFLGDTPDTVENQASKLVSHIPSGVLLGISQDGREGPGSYGLNRSVAQTVIIAKDGKVLHNFAFTQPMLRPDPYVLGAVGEAIGVESATLEKWLNVSDLTIAIKNPTEGEKTGRMLLNGNVVQFDELSTRLLNLPEERKSMLTIQSGREVLHEQIVKVMDIAKEAGIDKIEFAVSPAEGERMEGSREQMRRGEDSDKVAALRERLRRLQEKHEAARKQYEEIIRKLKQRDK